MTPKEQFHASVKSRNAVRFDKTHVSFRSQKDRDGFVDDMRAAGYVKELRIYTCGKGKKLLWCVCKPM